MRLPIANDIIAVVSGTPAATDPYNSGVRIKQDNSAAYITDVKAGATFTNGMLVASNGALVIVNATSSAPSGATYANGILVDPDGAVCASTGALVGYSNGFPVTATGALKMSQASSDVWLVASSWTPTAGSSGWAGYTLRLVVNATELPAATKLRFTLSSFSGSGGFQVRNMYIGAAGGGDVYDFATTPVQATFNNGAAGCIVASGGSIVTDTVNYTLLDSNSLVVAVSFVDSGVASSDVATIAAKTGWRGFYKLANDAATVDATGYTEGIIYLCTSVEYVA